MEIDKWIDKAEGVVKRENLGRYRGVLYVSFREMLEILKAIKKDIETNKDEMVMKLDKDKEGNIEKAYFIPKS